MMGETSRTLENDSLFASAISLDRVPGVASAVLISCLLRGSSRRRQLEVKLSDTRARKPYPQLK